MFCPLSKPKSRNKFLFFATDEKTCVCGRTYRITVKPKKVQKWSEDKENFPQGDNEKVSHDKNNFFPLKEFDKIEISNKKVLKMCEEKSDDIVQISNKVCSNNKNGVGSEEKEEILKLNFASDDHKDVIERALAIFREKDKNDPFLNVTANDLLWQPRVFNWQLSIPANDFDDQKSESQSDIIGIKT